MTNKTAVNALQQDLTVGKGKTSRKTKGIPVGTKGQFFVRFTKSHVRKGKQVRGYLKFYDAKTGKQVPKDKVKRIEKLATTKTIKERKGFDKTKKKTALTKVKEKRAKKKRLSKLRRKR